MTAALGLTVMLVAVFAAVVYACLQILELKAEQAKAMALLTALAGHTADIRDGVTSLQQAEDGLREHVAILRADIATVHMTVLAIKRPRERAQEAEPADNGGPGRWPMRETSSVRVIQVPRETVSDTSPREPVRDGPHRVKD